MYVVLPIALDRYSTIAIRPTSTVSVIPPCGGARPRYRDSPRGSRASHRRTSLALHGFNRIAHRLSQEASTSDRERIIINIGSGLAVRICGRNRWAQRRSDETYSKGYCAWARAHHDHCARAPSVSANTVCGTTSADPKPTARQAPQGSGCGRGCHNWRHGRECCRGRRHRSWSFPSRAEENQPKESVTPKERACVAQSTRSRFRCDKAHVRAFLAHFVAVSGFPALKSALR
jgi:hypothetical protein